MRISDWSSDVCSSDLLEIRSSEGEIITDEKRLKAIAADWDMLDQAMNAYGKDRPTSMSMVLSMPGGTTDAATIHDAVQAFARVEFEGQFRYMVEIGRASCRERVCQYV